MTITAAIEPNDLAIHFIEHANAGDVDALVALYEPDAVLAFPPGAASTGHAQIRAVYEQFVSFAPPLTRGTLHPPLICGDLALTVATQTNGDLTVGIARRRADGTWRWVVDQPALVA
ncbi:YybH family protein [Millisia brevis]|uniref:YybH family protein n=1 Tax=Millisia brevis TaxID=264148 RepID=UPI000AC48F01|nr:nuclear transport factor 2 family protein [Millisia brevis]